MAVQAAIYGPIPLWQIGAVLVLVLVIGWLLVARKKGG
jgi:hypothetical protein